MAQKVTVQLVDDLDGGPADETVSFSLDGTAYEIDLSATNATEMRDAFARYVGPARRVGGGRAAGRAAGRRTSHRRGGDSRTAEIREWARANGRKVNERGRLPATIIEAYEAAHR